MSDHIEGLSLQIELLDSEPVRTHPDVLDEVHRGLVGELERLAGVVSGERPQAPA